MLSDDAAVEEVTFGKNGIAEGLERGDGGTVHISHSTISIRLARQLEAEHGRRQQVYLSAPVFGRPDVAAAKRLIVVVAGAEEAQARCQPVFDAVGRQTFRVGTEGWRANLFKICGNFMLVSMVETFGEAFAAVRKAGMAPESFVEVMSELYGSPLFQAYGELIAAERFLPAGFVLRLGLKDTRLVLAAADELEAPMPIASLVRDHYLSALAHGQADWDWASVALVAAREAGLPARTTE
jgi:3-hydroxyisobutyrate dehydrogenase-like beta-hydroxyacid dehydrogenase